MTNYIPDRPLSLREQVIEHQRQREEFLATPLGKAFHRFENAAATYWQADGADASYTQLKRKDAAMQSAREELMVLLREAVGLGRGS
jgi:hypothetical protein